MISNIQSKCYPLSEHSQLKAQRHLWAIFAVLLLHLVALLLFRYLIKSQILKSTLEDVRLPVELEIVPSHYAEVNPEVAENQPDKSQFYSFQDQQAADTSSKKENSPVPLVDGSEISSSKIVSAEVLTEEAELPSGVYQLAPNENSRMESEVGQSVAAPLTYTDATSRSQINPFEVDKNQDGVDVITFKKEEILRPDAIGESKVIPITKDALGAIPQSASEEVKASEKNRPVPMERPKLSSEITSGPIMKSTASANKFGVIALDASFSEFGEYEQQFYSALQVGWYNEVAFYKPLDSGTQVSISFILKSDGSIDSVTVLSSTAGLIATTICESAITKRSPFRPWTQDMKQVFGDQKELRVRFYYR